MKRQRRRIRAYSAAKGDNISPRGTGESAMMTFEAQDKFASKLEDTDLHEFGLREGHDDRR